MIHFVLAYPVERGTKRGYEWRTGYAQVSPNGLPLYPWVTKREAQRIAREAGSKAVFHDLRNFLKG